MDSYQEVASATLHEFKCLLQRQSSHFGKMRLLQITVINLSIVDLISKSTNQNKFTQENRSQVLESAIQLAFDMFTIILRRLNSLGTNEMDNGTRRAFMPSIKIFIDWMLCNQQWQPLPDQLPPDLGPRPKRIRTIADALNISCQIREKTKMVLSKKVLRLFLFNLKRY